MRETMDRRSNMLAAVFFMIGIILSLLIIGSVAGFVGQVAQIALGSYWKIFAGIVAIIAGLGPSIFSPLIFREEGIDQLKAEREGIWKQR